MSDFFIKLLKLTERDEDTFTECLATTLAEDPDLRSRFGATLCGDEVDGILVRDARIEVMTQKNFHGCCVDMVFRLNDEKEIGVENKLWAPEGENQEGERQLWRYCQLGFSRLAFVTGYHASVDEGVLKHTCYLRPRNNRAHFLWADFHPLIEGTARKKGSSLLARALLEAFSYLGFTPPHPEVRDLRDPDPDRQLHNRENFAKLWEPTRLGLRKRGWSELMPGSIAELYVKRGIARRVDWAWIDPTWGTGVLRVRLTLRDGIVETEVAELLKSQPLPHGGDARVSKIDVRARKEPGTVIEVATPLRQLLGDAPDTESIAQRLAEFVLAVFDRVG